MAGVTFSVDDELAVAALDAVVRKVKHPAPLMDALGAHMVFSTQRNIERERSPEGAPWPRLSPRTAEKRVKGGRRGYDHMLRVTARLYQSINHAFTATSFEWGSNLVYARIHQLGGVIAMPERQATIRLRQIRTKGGGVRTRFASRRHRRAEERVVNIRGHQVRIPARPYLGVSPADGVALVEIAEDWIEAEVRK